MDFTIYNSLMAFINILTHCVCLKVLFVIVIYLFIYNFIYIYIYMIIRQHGLRPSSSRMIGLALLAFPFC